MMNRTGLVPPAALRLGVIALTALILFSGAPTDASAQGRGGRGGIRVMQLTSSAFTDGGAIPDKHAQPGHDASPPLSWSGAPDSTVSFVLIMRDIDAVSGDGTADVLHWMVWGIPGTMLSLPEGLPQGSIPVSAPVQVAGGPPGTAPAGGGGGRGAAAPQLRQLSVSGPYYRGPAAPANGPPHHYLFELYALDANINIQAGIASTAVTRQAVWDAMKGRIRGKAVLMGTYRRAAP
ncbi:MAG: YbhB/YbcL family Raf kinase inhibitor-like protein [Gemmatimonadota bacterium]|nr:YbhB/YbcL family Raf kinase inhibitor-like protein [Gemmatimonadota bacterium]